jgi:ferredoxin-NADP reductase
VEPVAGFTTLDLRSAPLCRLTVRSAVTVKLADDPRVETIPARMFPVKIVGLSRVAPEIVSLEVVTPRNQLLSFLGGQYATLRLKNGTARHYSIAAVEPESRVVTFHIRLVNAGAFSDWLAGAAKVGDLLQMEAPLGRFVFDTRHAERTLMVATGTGIVPIYAMLVALTPVERRQAGPMTLLWGNRVSSDAYLHETLAALGASMDFDYRPIFSQEGTRRRVTSEFPTVPLEGARVYAAGHPQMVVDIRRLALTQGIRPSDLRVDAFTFS